MKDKYTIIKEEFDEATGITTVEINTNYGIFIGTTQLDEEDSKYPSIYQGHELALSKALRKFAKQMVIITREKMQPLKAVLSQCAFIYSHSEEQVYGKATFLIRREIEKLEKELELWNKRVAALSTHIENRILTRDKIVKRYTDKPGQN